MAKKLFSIIFLTVAALIICTVSLYSQDWNQFRGPNRDCRVTGFKAPAKWPAELRQVWKVTVGTGDATPVLSGNRIYVHTRQGSEEAVICLDASTGKEIWKSTYPSPAVTGPSTSHPGPRSTPTVSGGKIVTLGVAGILSCFDASTGKLLWRKENPENLVPQFYTGMSPLVEDGIVIVHLGTRGNGTIYALDLNTGAEKWTIKGEDPAYSSPSIMKIDGRKHVIVFAETRMIAVDLADGKMQWSVPTPLQQRFYNSASPCIDGQKVYVTGQGTGMKAFAVEKKGSAYNPTELWSNTTTGTKWNTPVLKDGFLYGFTDTRKIFCINASTGETAWIDEAVNSDFATLVDCGQVFIGLPSTGNLLVFNPSPKGYSEVVRYKVAETAVYAFPVIAGNSIYVKDAENLTLFRLE